MHRYFINPLVIESAPELHPESEVVNVGKSNSLLGHREISAIDQRLIHYTSFDGE